MESKRLKEILQTMAQKQREIEAFGPWPKKVRDRVNYKIRLDWNYHSNRMEGGTLTPEETRSVMVGNIDVKGKPLKDVIEMKGHDDAVMEVLKVGHAEKRISEARIKALHTTIMHEESAENKKQIGQWKTGHNMIYSYKDEKIEFTPPDEVVDAVHGLLNDINAYLDSFFNGKHQEHPLIPIARFHVEYLSIHPFYDGNGRTARILTNLLLIACGLPPIIIKEERKKSYYQLLGDIQVYGGDLNLLAGFLGEQVVETQNLILKALEGESIDEPDDLDKQIALLEKELAAVDPDEEIKEHLGEAYFRGIYEGWLGELIKESVKVAQKFNKLFASTNHYISLFDGSVQIPFIDESWEDIREKLAARMDEATSRDFREHESISALRTHYGTLIKAGLNTFGCNHGLEVKFDTIKYSVWMDAFTEDAQRKHEKTIEDRLLHKPLTHEEIKKIAHKLGDTIFRHIDHQTKKAGIRPDRQNS